MIFSRGQSLVTLLKEEPSEGRFYKNSGWSVGVGKWRICLLKAGKTSRPDLASRRPAGLWEDGRAWQLAPYLDRRRLF
jgi:hypothetical protein